jgi:hypothetical protein
MTELFNEIYKNETNEKTAFILMLGVISEKLTEILIAIEKLNKSTKEVISTFEKESVVFVEPLSFEDYME